MEYVTLILLFLKTILEDATRFEVLVDMDVKIAVFWFVTPCPLLDEYNL